MFWIVFWAVAAVVNYTLAIMLYSGESAAALNQIVGQFSVFALAYAAYHHGFTKGESAGIQAEKYWSAHTKSTKTTASV